VRLRHLQPTAAESEGTVMKTQDHQAQREESRQWHCGRSETHAHHVEDHGEDDGEEIAAPEVAAQVDLDAGRQETRKPLRDPKADAAEAAVSGDLKQL